MRLFYLILFLTPWILPADGVKFTLFNVSQVEENQEILKNEQKNCEYSLTALTTENLSFHQIKNLNTFKIDLALLSPKDFYQGLNSLYEKIEKSQFHYLSSNVIDVKGNYLSKDALIYKIGDLKIGVLGLLFCHLPSISEGDRGVLFLDPYYVLEKKVNLLKEKGCDLVMLFSHLSLLEDVKIAKKVPAINVIVGSSSNFACLYEGDTLIYKGEKGQDSIDRIDFKIHRQHKAGVAYYHIYPSFRKISTLK